jgi:hypothetical protein
VAGGHTRGRWIDSDADGPQAGPEKVFECLDLDATPPLNDAMRHQAIVADRPP